MTHIFSLTCLLFIAISINVEASNEQTLDGQNINTAQPFTPSQAIEHTLNAFHQAAARADAVSYLNLLSDDAVFLGTDASERWNKAQFSDFVKPHFTRGNGWLYTPVERNITLLSDSNSAYFDELLDSASYGRCRGTGMLIKTAKGWKIAQYSLSVPFPNPIAKQLIKQIKQFEGK